jgi:hypothetical protein
MQPHDAVLGACGLAVVSVFGDSVAAQEPRRAEVIARSEKVEAHRLREESFDRAVFRAVARYASGDVTDDGLVTLADLNEVLAHFGRASPLDPFLPGDADLSGRVDLGDALIVIVSLGGPLRLDGDTLYDRLVAAGLYHGWGMPIGEEGGVALTSAPHYQYFSSTYPSSHSPITSFLWPNNHDYSISATRPPDHTFSFSSTWPGNHTINISLSWPQDHTTTHSNTYHPNHHQDASGGWTNPPIHATPVSRRWLPNHTLSASGSHQQAASNEGWPQQEHHDAFSGNWTHSEYSSIHDQGWRPNHWVQISNGWSPHSEADSARFPPSHFEGPSAGWPTTNPPIIWPPGHFAAESLEWSDPTDPKLWPEDHTLVTSIRDIKGASQTMIPIE